MPFNTFGNIFFWTSAKLTQACWTCINVEFTLRPILFVLKPVSQRGSLREGASQISGCKLWENHQFLRLELDQLLRKTECIITRGKGQTKIYFRPMHMCAQSPPDDNLVTKTIWWHFRQSIKRGLSDCWTEIDGKPVHPQFGRMVTDGNSIMCVELSPDTGLPDNFSGNLIAIAWQTLRTAWTHQFFARPPGAS